MHTFTFSILTPEKKLFQKEIASLVVNTEEGELTILANHAPLVSVMSIGTVTVRGADSVEEKFEMQGGVLEVKDHNKGVVLMSDTEVNAHALDLDSLEEEIARAKIAMNEKVDENAFTELEGSLERNLYLRKILSKRK